MLPLGPFVLAVLTSLGATTSLQPQIPSVASFTESDGPAFLLSTSSQIIVDSDFQDSGSPSLITYAQTFRNDLITLTGLASIPEVTTGSLEGSDASSIIFLSLGATNHTYFSGVATEEGYDFVINSRSYIIKGSGAIGVWWGTRTLLQQVALSPRPDGTIAAGSGSDTPGWEVRGFMLDAARHWFEPSFLADLCTYASFFKLQTFHIHASDNIWDQNFISGPDWRKLYSAFRFQPAAGSPIAGLIQLQNETWSKDDFTALQTTCSHHGVTIVPEVDTPGHSLAISKWKPELMIPNAPDNLNLSHPDTIPTIKAIWDEILPWFTSAEVSIGADEYDSALANDYISFVNEMSEYIAQSGKSIRIWGTNEPSTSASINTNVTIQHWDFPGDSIPVQLMNRGYRVINSEQQFLYLDGKTGDGQFPVELDQSLMWSGAPGGGGWAPNIFSRDDSSNNTSPDNPLLRGSIMALWNDWGNNATTPLEIYYQLSRSLAVFAEKVWAGSGVRDTALTQDQFNSVYQTLNVAAPGQNLNRAVSSQPNNIIFQYPTVSEPQISAFDSVGPPYTLTFTVKPSNVTEINVPLLDGTFMLIPYDGGLIFAGNDSKLHAQSLSFEDPTTQIRYPLSYTLPSDAFTTVEIHATRTYTYALIEGSVYWWLTDLDIWGEAMKPANMSFAAPSHFIRGDDFFGDLYNVSLVLGS
ncbi:glycoside hydrolase family 20 protein [Mycena alexandri]|uniref:beta-N-acetylhexosaminidase n=1 Tax=Mycena alexandri TaxID=1745969 RepID=A0AAD6X7R4_9AGAR|nr:glycoside hydrolase family 20 protein [Mycena alexandri]